jgi:erythromycin esterase
MDLTINAVSFCPALVWALCSCGGEATPMMDPTPDASPAQPDAASGLPAGLYRLAGTDPDLPDDDLAPLDAVIGDAPLVALGESVHTSGGYSAAKVRIFEHLVTRQHFRVFAFETPRTDALATGRYVTTCQGTPEQALNGLFPVWANTSVRDVLVWMCTWNRQHPDDPVAFHGFDIQQPWDDARALRQLLARLGENSLPAGIDGCDGASYDSSDAYFRAHPDGPGNITALENQSCLAGVRAIDDYLTAHASSIIAATSPEALAEARMASRGLRAWQGEAYYYMSDSTASTSARDEGMADVLEALRALRFPNARAVVWAHNFHIGAQQDHVAGHANSMGSFLKHRLGEAYRPIGLVGYQVDINWPHMGCGPLPPPVAPDAVEVMLHGLGARYLLVNLATTTFFSPGRSYELGGEEEGQGSRMIPAHSFSALLYLDHSPAMKSLSWPDCTPAQAAWPSTTRAKAARK